MINLGDITKISGYNAPTVDVVIGGSPCQDLSVAGKRAGLAGERSGLYLEAKQNMIMLGTETGRAYYETGDVTIEVDFYDAKKRVWEQLGKDNPFWEVVCWADILKPDIPDGARDRLVEYFGEKVQWQDGHWCQDTLQVEENENNADA